MKYSTTTLVFVIFIYFNLANSKSMKSFNGNSLKSQRKPLASPLGNSIHDDYKRAKRELSLDTEDFEDALNKVKRQLPKAIRDFQNTLNKAKDDCARELRMDPTKITVKTLLHEENPTRKEKCLMSCVLSKTKLMDNTNKLSTASIARVAGMVSNQNPLIVSVAVATAKNCNNVIKTTDKCEAAFQINKCIAGEMKAYKLNLFY